MSVYIKGMEMPKEDEISKCIIIRHDGEVWLVDLDNLISEWGYVTCYPTNPMKAIPVPEHGRLIEAGGFAAEMKKRQDACAEWRDGIKSGGGYGTELFYRVDGFLGAMCEAKLTLDKMPTIIPADQKKEGET